MNRKGISMLLAIVMLLTLCSCPSAFAEEGDVVQNFVNDSFETNETNADLHDWTMSGLEYGSISVETDDGNNKLVLTRTETGDTSQYTTAVRNFTIDKTSNNNLVRVSFRTRCTSNVGGPTIRLFGKTGAGKDDIIANIDYRNTNGNNPGLQIRLESGFLPLIETPDINTYYKVTIIMNLQTKKMDVYLDDVLKVSGATFRKATVGSFDRFEASIAHVNVDGYLYIDDLSVDEVMGETLPEDTSGSKVLLESGFENDELPSGVSVNTSLLSSTEMIQGIGSTKYWVQYNPTDNANGDVRIVERNGSQMLQITGTDTDIASNTLRARTYLTPVIDPSPEYCMISLRIYTDEIADSSEFGIYFNGPGIGTVKNYIYRDRVVNFNSDGYLWRDNSPYHDLAFLIDYVDKKMYLYVDGEQCGAKSMPFTVEADTGLGESIETVQLGAWGAFLDSKIYIDNVQILSSTSLPALKNGVSIDETAYVDYSMSANFEYDPDGSGSSQSEVMWITSSSIDGIYTPIEGAKGLTYTPTADLAGKYIKARVLPKDANGFYGMYEESEPVLVEMKVTDDDIEEEDVVQNFVNDNFETTETNADLHDWTMSGLEYGSISVETDDGNNKLVLTRTETGDTSQYTTAVRNFTIDKTSNDNLVRVSFRTKCTNTVGGVSIRLFGKKSDGNDGIITNIESRSTSGRAPGIQIMLENNEFYSLNEAPDINTYYKITIVMDLRTRKVDVYLDDELKVSDTTFRTASVGSFERIEFWMPHTEINKSLYIDDLTIDEIEGEPLPEEAAESKVLLESGFENDELPSGVSVNTSLLTNTELIKGTDSTRYWVQHNPAENKDGDVRIVERDGSQMLQITGTDTGITTTSLRARTFLIPLIIPSPEYCMINLRVYIDEIADKSEFGIYFNGPGIGSVKNYIYRDRVVNFNSDGYLWRDNSPYHDLAFLIDYVDKKMYLYVDGEQCGAQSMPFTVDANTGLGESIEAVQLGAWGTFVDSKLYVDNVQILSSTSLPNLKNGVSIDETAYVNYPLSANFEYDPDVSGSSQSEVVWTTCSRMNGIYTPIEGAKGLTYTPTADLAGKYIKARVLPKDANGFYGMYEESEPVLVEMKVTDEERVANEKTDFVLDVPLFITESIDLPAVGKYKTNLTWSSSNETLLSSAGVYTPEVGLAENGMLYKQVTLTANISYGQVSDTKDIVVNVANNIGENLFADSKVAASSAATGSVTKNVSDTSFDTYWQAGAVQESNLTFTLPTKKLFNRVLITPKGSGIDTFTIETSDNKSAWTTVYTGNALVADDMNIIKLDHVNSKYLRINFTGNSTEEPVAVYEISAYYVPSDEDLVIEALEKLTLPQQSLNSDIELPTSDSNGALISWSSSNENVLASDGKVTRPSKGNASVTLTATITSGNVSETKKFLMTVSGLSQGSSSSGGGSGSGGSGGKGTPVRLIPVMTPTQPGVSNPSDASSKAFNDLTGYEWAENAIITLNKEGIIVGDGDGKFNPSRQITREEFVTLLVRFKGLKATKEYNFSDIANDHWAYPFVCAAFENGIITGISDDMFGTGHAITREDMAVIIYRLAKDDLDETGKNCEKTFADIDEISEYAGEAVTALYNAGIINGIGEDVFNPKGAANRAEAAKIIYALYNK